MSRDDARGKLDSVRTNWKYGIVYLNGCEVERLIDEIYDDFEDNMKKLEELREMREWMEKHSNTSLCDWYNREV